MKKSAYTVAEAAEEYSLPQQRIANFCRSGDIGVKVGTQWVISDDDMQELYRRLREESREEAGLR